jgi:hypothetical protein
MIPRALLLGLFAVAAVGCGKTVTEEDCRKVGENMRTVWMAEAKKAAPEDPAGAEKAQAVIQAEAQKLVSDWSAECKKELAGRRVDSKELGCLYAAKTIADVNRCAGIQ